MVKKHALRWTQVASDDLKFIFDYICDVDCKRQAYYVVSEIKKQAQKVLIFPELYPQEPKTEDIHIRFTVKWRYKIIFKIDKNTVYIARIFYASQNPDNLTIDI
jgi:plasmid stabilization system protein ParE